MPLRKIIDFRFENNRGFTVVQGNLLEESVDCIVNAANGALAHGGGVAAIIAKAAGPELIAEGDSIVCQQGTIPTGSAVVTTSGNLPFRGVIHAVGPRWGEGDERAKLESALTTAFELAAERGWQSLSFPAISSGIFAVPHDLCARAYCQAVAGFFAQNPRSPLTEIRLCLLAGPLLSIVAEEFDRRFHS